MLFATTPEFSREPAVKAYDCLLGKEHRDNHDDQGHESVESPAETQAVTEHDVERFENDELGPEKQQPRAEEAHEFRKAALPRIKECGDPMFKGYRQLQEDLQQQGDKQRDRERVDSNVLRILDEQVQHHE